MDTLRRGDTVTFHTNGILGTDLEQSGLVGAGSYNKKRAIIDLKLFSHDNGSYYVIQFLHDGMVWFGISDEHLTKVKYPKRRKYIRYAIIVTIILVLVIFRKPILEEFLSLINHLIDSRLN